MWKLLLSFLRLGVEPSPESEPQAPPEDDGIEADDGLETQPEPPPPAVTEPPEVTAIRLRAEAAERRAEEAERRAAQPTFTPPPKTSDPEFEREEAMLADLRRQGANAETLAWNEWKISKDRNERALRKEVNESKSYTADVLDKSNFDRLEATEPRRYKHFAAKVEAAVAEFRRNGQTPPPRTAIYNYMVGEAVRNGSLKPAAKPAAQAAPATPVNRGRLPPARSDVNPKDRSGMTEHQKRIARMKAEHEKGHYL